MYSKKKSLKVYVLFVSFATLFSCSSTKNAPPQTYTSYSYPTFLGSDSAYHDFVIQSIKYSAEMSDEGASTRVIVNCLVGQDGSLLKVSTPYDNNPSIERKLEETLLNIPRLVSENNLPTDVLYVLPIVFLPYDGVLLEPCELSAQFPGGGQELTRYVTKYLKYSLTDRLTNKKGTTAVDFIINEKGYVKDIRLAESFSNTSDSSLLQLVRKMPRWSSARRLDGESRNVEALCKLTVVREGSFLKSTCAVQLEQFAFVDIDTDILPEGFFDDIFLNKGKVQYLEPVTIVGQKKEYITRMVRRISETKEEKID